MSQFSFQLATIAALANVQTVGEIKLALMDNFNAIEKDAKLISTFLQKKKNDEPMTLQGLSAYIAANPDNLCIFGTGCQRRDCNYNHPEGFVCSESDFKMPCRYGKLCMNARCEFAHPKGWRAPVCKNGPNCPFLPKCKAIHEDSKRASVSNPRRAENRENVSNAPRRRGVEDRKDLNAPRRRDAEKRGSDFKTSRRRGVEESASIPKTPRGLRSESQTADKEMWQNTAKCFDPEIQEKREVKRETRPKRTNKVRGTEKRESVTKAPLMDLSTAEKLLEEALKYQ